MLGRLDRGGTIWIGAGLLRLLPRGGGGIENDTKGWLLPFHPAGESRKGTQGVVVAACSALAVVVRPQCPLVYPPHEEVCFFERRWDELSPLVDGSMAASSAMVPLVKVEKKIAQISRVIQHLNAKSDDSDLDSLAGGRVERG